MKDEFRKKIKETVKENLAKTKEESKIICIKILNSPLYQTSDTLLSYMSLPSEVDLSQVTQDALQKEKKVYVPKVYPSETFPLMKFHQIKNLEQTKVGKYGILEPKEDAKIFTLENFSKVNSTSSNILILVPALALTKDGRRLGKGKGYYDYFLSKLKETFSNELSNYVQKKCRVFVAGVCFSFQLLDTLPTQKHDIKMDYIFSPYFTSEE